LFLKNDAVLLLCFIKGDLFHQSEGAHAIECFGVEHERVFLGTVVFGSVALCGGVWQEKDTFVWQIIECEREIASFGRYRMISFEAGDRSITDQVFDAFVFGFETTKITKVAFFPIGRLGHSCAFAQHEPVSVCRAGIAGRERLFDVGCLGRS